MLIVLGNGMIPLSAEVEVVIVVVGVRGGWRGVVSWVDVVVGGFVVEGGRELRSGGDMVAYVKRIILSKGSGRKVIHSWWFISVWLSLSGPERDLGG